jgi:hypothetical protein
MRVWEDLTDEERLTWYTGGKSWRMKGINYFKQVNLRRVRRGEEPARVPLPRKARDSRPLVKGLEIENRGGRITLELVLRRAPEGRWTVWASLPCNLGLRRPHKCPRLDWLPVTQGRRVEITALYFRKHGAYIRQHALPLEGKRIFVRVRQEVDEGAQLYEQVRAVVPKPEVATARNRLIPSKDLRIPFEEPSKPLRTNTPTSRLRHATPALAGSRGWRRGQGCPKPAGRSRK